MCFHRRTSGNLETGSSDEFIWLSKGTFCLIWLDFKRMQRTLHCCPLVDSLSTYSCILFGSYLHSFDALMSSCYNIFYRYEANTEVRVLTLQPSTQTSRRTGRWRRGGRWRRKEGIRRAQAQTRAPAKLQQCHIVPGVQHSAQLQSPGPDPLQGKDAPEEAAATGKGCQHR